MSYCRWRSDDFACDLYCYEDAAGGWTTHVAGKRILGNIPKVGFPEQGADDATAATQEWVTWADGIRTQHVFLETAEREDIKLRYVGETFNDPTLEAFRARLLELRSLSYRFPDYVLERIDEEIKQRDAA